MIERYERRLHYNKKSNQKQHKNQTNNDKDIIGRNLLQQIRAMRNVMSRSAYSNGVPTIVILQKDINTGSEILRRIATYNCLNFIIMIVNV